MKTNHQMNYYDYSKSLDAQGVMRVIGGGVNPEPEPETDYVDLGLPSGTLWAKHNIQDANGNELYFAWGETSGYTAEQVGVDKNFIHGDYTDESGYNDYKFWSKQEGGECEYITKYSWCDYKYNLEPEDDAATVNLGEDWRMPAEGEFVELTENTTSAWTQVNGVNGILFTSTANTNTLFFPALGVANNGELHDVGSYGKYWSNLVGNNSTVCAFSLIFSDRYCVVYEHDEFDSDDGNYWRNGRGSGCSVRPVRSNN